MTTRALVAGTLAVGIILVSVAMAGCHRSTQVPAAWSITIPQKNIYGETGTVQLAYHNGSVFCVGSPSFDNFEEATLYSIYGSTGAISWQRGLRMSKSCGRFTLFACGGAVICYRTPAGELKGLDGQTGMDKWTYSDFSSIVTIADSTVHVLDGSGRYVALDANGMRTRGATGPVGGCDGPTVYAEDRVYGTQNHRLRATDIVTGRVLWEDNMDASWLYLQHGMAVLLVMVPDRTGQRLRALDVQDGRELWSRTHWGAVPAVDGDTVFLAPGTPDLRDVVVRLDVRTGKELGTFRASLWPSAKPLVADGLFYSPVNHSEYLGLGQTEYGLVAKNSASGEDLWETCLSRGSTISEPIAGDGLVFVQIPNSDGKSVSLLGYKIPK